MFHPFLALSFALLVSVLVAACGTSREPAPREASSAQPAGDSARLERAPAKPERAAGTPRIVFLGDSLTAGLGLPDSESFPALIQDRLDRDGYTYEVVNAGVSGDTSAGGLRRLDWSLEGNVKILVVALGANDGLRGLPVDDLRRNLSAIIEKSTARGVQVILVGMEAPPNNGPEYTVAFRSIYTDVARAHHVPLVPFLLLGVAGEASLNQADGIHPNTQGAERLAETVWHTLVPALSEQTGPSRESNASKPTMKTK